MAAIGICWEDVWDLYSWEILHIWCPAVPADGPTPGAGPIGFCWEDDVWDAGSWEDGSWCPRTIAIITPIDKTWCFSRRGERDLLSCLRRSDETIQALRRPPECPDELACPVGGCT